MGVYERVRDVGQKLISTKWLSNETPREIKRVISEKGLGYFGPPKVILTDNGGEFQNEGMCIFTERFNRNEGNTERKPVE